MNVFAQGLTLPDGTTLKGPVTTATNIGGIVTKAFPYVIAFAGFGLLLMIIAAGFTLLTSAGDAKKTEQGKQRLTYAIVGFLLVFGSVFLVQVISKILGVKEATSIF